MPTDLNSTLYFIARLLLGGAFVVFGIRNIKALPRLTAAMETRGLPMARLAMMFGIGIQIVGGAMVATGLFAAWGAAALIFFVLVAAYLFHSPWDYPADERTPHINACIMNTGLAGAFLMVIATTV